MNPFPLWANYTIHVGQKYHPYLNDLMVYEVTEIYLFHNANGAWGARLTFAHDGHPQGDTSLDEFTAAIETGAIVLIGEQNENS